MKPRESPLHPKTSFSSSCTNYCLNLGSFKPNNCAFSFVNQSKNITKELVNPTTLGKKITCKSDSWRQECPFHFFATLEDAQKCLTHTSINFQSLDKHFPVDQFQEKLYHWFWGHKSFCQFWATCFFLHRMEKNHTERIDRLMDCSKKAPLRCIASLGRKLRQDYARTKHLPITTGTSENVPGFPSWKTSIGGSRRTIPGQFENRKFVHERKQLSGHVPKFLEFRSKQ